jgi:hypothetical protein
LHRRLTLWICHLQLLVALLAGLGAFSVLHHLGFGIIYKVGAVLLEEEDAGSQ